MIVQNPTIVHERGMEPESELEPFIIKYNENRPYSLLQTTKRWTIAVQSFSAPVRYVSRDDHRPIGRMKRDADILMAGEKQADTLVRALREMKGPPTAAYPAGQPLGLDAYVLHMRHASIVTVGQFDSPNDPELQEKIRALSNLRFNLSKDQAGFQMTGASEKLFAEKLQPIPIPKH
jgi:hypothetical protein